MWTPYLALLAHIADPPDGLRSVVRDVHRTVLGDRDAHWPAPCRSIGSHESSQEVLIHTAGMAGVPGPADYSQPGALGAVPRAVLGCEQVSAILRRKLRPLVE